MAFSHLKCTFAVTPLLDFANQTFWTALASWVVNLSFEQFPPVYIPVGIFDIS